MHQNKNKYQIHLPVLLNEVIEVLSPKEGDNYLDLTAGYGGHASKVLSLTGNYKDSALVDRDQDSIKELKDLFKGDQIEIIKDDFNQASKDLLDEGKQFDLILADLGVSSLHFNEGNRGFSIQQVGPLDMRMDQSQKLTAEHIVNNYSELELTEILRIYGEEPKARQMAREIISSRPLQTTEQLAEVAKRVWKGYSKSHPATRTFQAIRIAVNDELRLIEESLPIWLDLLKPEGRLAIISFHSLEDRIVKNFFSEHGGNYYDSQLKILTKKPITPQQNEIDLNPRARSAKLRAAVKIKTKKGN
jgi:16S rRNA (cytosine1402-N4)-methyltransferase